MRLFFAAITCSVLFLGVSAFAGLPKCRYIHWDPSETAINESTDMAVILDDRLMQEGHGEFQVWDLKTKKLLGIHDLPFANDQILGFADADTVVFASIYSYYVQSIMRYHISTRKVETFPAAVLTLNDYSVAANFAFLSQGDWWSHINLRTGEIQNRDGSVAQGWIGEIPKVNGAFSKDGSAYFNVHGCGPGGGCPTADLTIDRWQGPKFLEKNRTLIAQLSRKDIGMDEDFKSQAFAWSEDADEKGSVLVIAFDVKNYAKGRKLLRSVMWVDIKNGNRISCPVVPRGMPKIKIVNADKKLIYLQGDAVGYHLNKIIDMNNCRTTSLPVMEGLQSNRAGGIVSTKTRNYFYSLGGIWDFDTGETLIRTCE